LASLHHGVARIVLCIGSYAIKLPKGKRGLRCNVFEADLWARTTEARRKMLCPVLASLPFGLAVVMPRLQELTETQAEHLRSSNGFPDWDYGGMLDDETPWEFKAGDWGWLEGRPVAFDFSVSALE
jgi:hypothetical protein